MVHKRSKKSLYEVMGETRPKWRYGKTLEQPHPGKSDRDKPTAAKPAMRMSERVMRWPKGPRIVQFNAGRVEISMPYQLAIAVLLGVILLVLVFFRLGQISSLSSQNAVDSAVKMPESPKPASPQKAAPSVTAGAGQMPELAKEETAVSAAAEKAGPVESKGNNRIVIQTYRLRAHLEPVKQYFAENGVETEIRKIGGMYYLVTGEKYENPEKQGTDGYLAKQKIIELGAEYKAPSGYETFGNRPFHDAYGMRFDD